MVFFQFSGHLYRTGCMWAFLLFNQKQVLDKGWRCCECCDLPYRKQSQCYWSRLQIQLNFFIVHRYCHFVKYHVGVGFCKLSGNVVKFSIFLCVLNIFSNFGDFREFWTSFFKVLRMSWDLSYPEWNHKQLVSLLNTVILNLAILPRICKVYSSMKNNLIGVITAFIFWQYVHLIVGKLFN